jgi:hypothetical protein
VQQSALLKQSQLSSPNVKAMGRVCVFVEHISQQGQPHRHRVAFQFSNDTQRRGARDRTFMSFVKIGRPGEKNEVARTICRKQRIGYSRLVVLKMKVSLGRSE